MEAAIHRPAQQLTALLIAPDRELALQFAQTLPATRAFQILGDLKTYPPQQILEMRLRQLQPDVVLLDLATELAAAENLIRLIAQVQPDTQVVGLHRRNDSEAILRSLRVGASEFLYAPFDPAVQAEAVGRLRRLRRFESPAERELGKVVVFASAKPGSGASTLAAQIALALGRITDKRVLLADLDLVGGSLGFYLRVDSEGSLLDALEDHCGAASPNWCSLVAQAHGLDVLTAPDMPNGEQPEPSRLHDLLEGARRTYGWIILDLPAIFHRTSLLAWSESDDAFLVATPELPSLHLARKAVNLLSQIGFPRERYRVLINRSSRRDELRNSDMEKIFNVPVHASVPDDYLALDRVVTMGQALNGDSELGRAVEDVARRLAGVPAAEKRRSAVVLTARPVFSES
ncbi:MAG: MinD/ParA family protein [Acidobacteria bacterium]|nr:MinD/ParA family protein [Acidobacteriota bacterium]